MSPSSRSVQSTGGWPRPSACRIAHDRVTPICYTFINPDASCQCILPAQAVHAGGAVQVLDGHNQCGGLLAAYFLPVEQHRELGGGQNHCAGLPPQNGASRQAPLTLSSTQEFSPLPCRTHLMLAGRAGKCRLDMVLISEVIKEHDLWAYPYNALRNQALARATTDVSPAPPPNRLSCPLMTWQYHADPCLAVGLAQEGRYSSALLYHRLCLRLTRISWSVRTCTRS